MLDLKLGEWCKIPLYDKIQNTDKKHLNYGQVTIAQESDGWKHNEWDISWYSDEKREFKVVDEDFLWLCKEIE